MNIINIVGRKNSGKTTLVEKLISALVGRGIAVGSIKHTPHQHSLDTPGKDSWRHRQAGARPAALITPDGAAVFNQFPDHDKKMKWVLDQMRDLELVIIEGAKNQPGTKIEVVRSEISSEPICTVGEGLIAIATDLEHGPPGVEVLDINNVEGLADFILEWRKNLKS